MASRLKLGDDLQSSSSSSVYALSVTSQQLQRTFERSGNCFVPDVDLAVLAQEYEDIQALSPEPTDPRKVLRMICSSKYPSPSSLARTTTLARILVCKPQSADCERLISAQNRLKSSQRNSLEHATIGNYLYIKHATIDIIRSSPSFAALDYRERQETQRHSESFQTELVQQCLRHRCWRRGGAEQNWETDSSKILINM